MARRKNQIKAETARDREPMSERELARRIEAERDGLSAWEFVKVEVAPSPKTRFSVPFESEELRLLERRAQAEGVTITEFIRRAALTRVGEPISVAARD